MLGNRFENLFAITNTNERIKIEDGKIFPQRMPGRSGFLSGVDKKLTERGERAIT